MALWVSNKMIKKQMTFVENFSTLVSIAIKDIH